MISGKEDAVMLNRNGFNQISATGGKVNDTVREITSKDRRETYPHKF